LRFEAFVEETVGYRLSRKSKSRSARRPRAYNVFALESFLREWRVAVMAADTTEKQKGMGEMRRRINVEVVSGK
jgi:hypothetical protein